jgi:transcription antitermination factor NusG
MIRLSDNPPTRFPQRPIREAPHPWWVVKLKPRQEKSFAFDLLREEIEYYLPLYTKVTRRKDNNKPRKSIVCLFPGYISVALPKESIRFLYASNRIVNVVEVRNQKRFVRQLDQVYHAMDLGMALAPVDELEQFSLGQEVEVQVGPMKGMVGTIAKMKKGNCLVLAVDGLGKAALAIDASQVKPV